MLADSDSDRRTRTRMMRFAAIVTAAFVVAACASPIVAPPPDGAETVAPAAEVAATAAQPMPTAAPAATAAPVQEPASTGDADQYAELAVDLETALDAFAADQKFSGTVIVARDGEVLAAKGYGYADRLAQTPNDVQTRYRIGSLTKQFTAMLTLMLHERGLLDIGDLICDYIEDCPDTWAEITIEQLLTHTSGIPDFTEFPDYERTKGEPSTLVETIARFRDEPLQFTPGDRWRYSNSNYILLGQIIEHVTGQSYEDFAQESLFGPLGMTNTGYDHAVRALHDHNREDLAVGYVNAGGAEADFIDMSIPHAAGALYSAAEDMLKWDRALADGELISAELQDAMFTAHAPIPDSGGFGYGYGWAVGEEFGQPVVFHSGGIEGFSANITRFLGDGTLIVTLSNEQQTNPQAVARTVMRTLYAGE